MGPRSFVRRLLASIAIGGSLLAAGACGGRYEQIAGAPASLLRVEVPSGANRTVLAGVRSVAGVTNVAGFSLVDVRVKSPAKASIKIAVVDPAEVESLAGALAGGGSSSANLRGGLLLMPVAEREKLGIAPGGLVRVIGARGGAHNVAVADLSDELAGTGAAGVVARDRVPWLETGKPTLLFVAVSPEADANATAATLASKLRADVGVSGKTPPFLAGRAASQLFGSFRYVVNPDGTIQQDPSWVRRYIVRTRVPILKWVTCHRMMVPQLRAALADVERAGLASKIDLDDFGSSGGCYVARKMLWDPNLPVSMHAWGLAIDFNVAGNQYGARPTMDPRIVEIFERWGFRWGGRWQTPDGMHFELAALVRR